MAVIISRGHRAVFGWGRWRCERCQTEGESRVFYTKDCPAKTATTSPARPAALEDGPGEPTSDPDVRIGR